MECEAYVDIIWQHLQLSAAHEPAEEVLEGGEGTVGSSVNTVHDTFRDLKAKMRVLGWTCCQPPTLTPNSFSKACPICFSVGHSSLSRVGVARAELASRVSTRNIILTAGCCLSEWSGRTSHGIYTSSDTYKCHTCVGHIIRCR